MIVYSPTQYNQFKLKSNLKPKLEAKFEAKFKFPQVYIDFET